MGPSIINFFTILYCQSLSQSMPVRGLVVCPPLIRDRECSGNEIAVLPPNKFARNDSATLKRIVEI